MGNADAKGDAEILGLAGAVHDNEIVAAMEMINVTPMETAEVDRLRVKRAGELAMLVPLDDEKFAAAYLAAMIKQHTEVLDMIDNQLLKRAANDAVKVHLTEAHGSVAKHPAAAKQLQTVSTR